MVGLNAFSVLLFIGIITSVIKVSKLKDTTQNKIIRIIALILLIVNSPRLFRTPFDIPVEFSAVTYYIAPVIILFNNKKLEIWAVYSAIMAGFLYYFTMMSLGENIYGDFSPIIVYISLISHGSLLFIGLLKLRTTKYNENEYYKLIIGNLIILSWAIFIRPEITSSGKIFIYEIIDGNIVRSFTSSYLWIFIPIYYILLTYVLYKSSRWIFKMNNFSNRRYKLKRNNDRTKNSQN